MEKSLYSEDGQIRKHRLQHLELAAVMGAGRGFLPIYAVFAISAVIIIYPGVSRAITALWVSFYLIYTVVRTIATSLYHEDVHREKPFRILGWRRFVFFSALTHGMILGSLAAIALPVLDPARQLVLTAFVLVITTGAIVYVSAVLPALLVLVSASLLPYSVFWYLMPSSFEMPVAAFLFAVWLISILMSFMHHKAESRLFCLVADNEILVKALEEKNMQLEIADRERLQLLAVTSHDLRQPVHALGLILAHASEYDDVKSIGKHFEKMKDISSLISEMLLELMDLSMLDYEKSGKRIEEVSLTAILMQLKISQEPVARRKGISFNVRSDREIWVLADAGLLRRMLLNMISNAIKYTAIGSVEIECNVQSSQVLITVRDTGIGIPSEKFEEIFDPFVKLNPGMQEKDSVGLGLSIVRRAALLQGFKIQVSSTVGKGSVFELHVPLVTSSQRSHELEVRKVDFSPARDVLIAVVDDDFFAREALVMLLQNWGYSTVSAESLDDLRRALNVAQKPMLIIADNHLSRVEFGPDAIKAVRERFDDFRILGIVVTGDSSVKINGLSGVEIAHKPIKPVYLKELVARLTSGVSS